MNTIHPTALVILDGFGYRTITKYNAIAHARMPNFNMWWRTYPHAILAAAGASVGLPDNMIGNSEVGHVTIGAGRVIEQPMKIWLESIADGSFTRNKILQEQFEKLVSVGGRLQVIGLLSDAGVHCHEKEIYAVIKAAIKAGIKKVIVHPILDGRDVLARSAHDYLERLAQVIKYYNNGQVVIGSVHGRFYAMDRDNNWDRIEKSYRVLTEKQDASADSWEKVLERNYAHSITDEFVVPTQLNADAIVHNGDGIIFCNVRPDRARELTSCFINPMFHFVSHGDPSEERQNMEHEAEWGVRSKCVPFTVKPLNLTFFITPVDYGDGLNSVVLFPRTAVQNTLKDILAQHDKTIFTIAETEKYAHVTYFFRGENEQPVATETRHMIASLPAKDYVAFPQMRAAEITQAVIASLETNPADFYLINYANADMVGHSGNFGATVKAVEFLDAQLGLLYEEIIEKMGGTLYITADHGKAEDMFDENAGQARTAHTNNPVPFVMVNPTSPRLPTSLKLLRTRRRVGGVEGEDQELPLHELADIAPFVLKNMGIKK